VTRVDPTRAFRYGGASSRQRETADEVPKRLLALDGGGMRGLITMQVLRRMEELLGGGDESYRLAQTFDFVVGTSTGAIIAAAIAMGHPIAAVQDMYEQLGLKIFRKRWLPGWWRSKYKDGPVSEVLKGSSASR
jgi:patatin-like phospholipase/acyl hydrolase